MRISDWSSDVCSSDLGDDIAAASILNHQRRQAPGLIGAGVDSYPVGPFVHLVDDRVSMDDHEPVCLLLAEERFAYPAEVGKVLLLKVDAGADARMDEEIVAETERVGQPLQKLPMRWRHAVLDEPDARLPVHSSQFLEIGRASCRERGCRYV